MSIIWSIIWGLLTLTIMSVTIKYYLPLLWKRTQGSDSEILATSNEEEKKYTSVMFQKRSKVILMLVLCGGYSAWCGYMGAESSNSITSIIKMTIAMGVLSCIFITDIELMIIPNLCSIILIVSRLLTVVYEVIWIQEEAVSWLVNSIIAMIIVLIFLFIMAKLTHGGLGMGDVKLFSCLGFLCGVRAVFFTLMFAFWFCAIISTILCITKKKKLKDALPLGPFIWIGYGVTVLLAIM